MARKRALECPIGTIYRQEQNRVRMTEREHWNILLIPFVDKSKIEHIWLKQEHWKVQVKLRTDKKKNRTRMATRRTMNVSVDSDITRFLSKTKSGPDFGIWTFCEKFSSAEILVVEGHHRIELTVFGEIMIDRLLGDSSLTRLRKHWSDLHQFWSWNTKTMRLLKFCTSEFFH